MKEAVGAEHEGVEDAARTSVAICERVDRLTLVHSGDVEAEFWDMFGPGGGGVGWDLAFAGVGHHLDTGSDVPLGTSEWATSDAAKRFMAASAERWGDAAIAAGAPEDVARAQQAATTGFYASMQDGAGAE